MMLSLQPDYSRDDTHISRRPLALALAMSLGLASIPLASSAATIVVQNSDDPGTATGCSLRQAIVSMNTGTVAGTGCVNSGAAFGTGDTINFDATVFPFYGANTITLADSSSGTLTISDANLTIAARPYAPVTIQRGAAAANKFRVMYDIAPDGGSLTLSRLTIRNGDSSGGPSCNGKNGGGGICILNADLTLTNSTISENYAVGYSGGILSRAGNVTLTDSTVSNNTSSKFAGGIYVFNKTLTLTNSTVSGNAVTGTPFSYGGGIFSQSANIVMNNSTLSGNSASYAGGIWSWTGNITATNSTVSGNAATTVGGANGNAGGIWAAAGTVALYNSTVSANSAASNAGGIFTGGGGPAKSIHTVNSIIAGNSAPGGDTNATPDGSSTNNFIGSDPHLTALADNGGPTKTMLPQANSPVIDAGSDGANCQATDQRGVKRPQGAHCDLGAVELLTAQIANAGLLFTNWSGGIDVNGPLYTGGGDCSGSCFAIADNFSNGDRWTVTSFNVYMISANGITGGNWRYALFDAAGNAIVAPTNAMPTFTDLGLFTGPYSGTYEVYQIGISGLNIDLPPGQYQLRFTNTQVQSIYPAFGIQTSAQTIGPGFVQLTGSPTVEALLSTDVIQRTQEWAFDLSGNVISIFKNGFEGP